MCFALEQFSGQVGKTKPLETLYWIWRMRMELFTNDVNVDFCLQHMIIDHQPFKEIAAPSQKIII